MSDGKFHRLHYNFAAKILRQNFAEYAEDSAYQVSNDSNLKKIRNASLSVVVNIAIDFAKAFKEDNPSFDSLVFLDACSPDTDLYPLSELWEHAQDEPK